MSDSLHQRIADDLHARIQFRRLLTVLPAGRCGCRGLWLTGIRPVADWNHAIGPGVAREGLAQGKGLP